MESPNCTLQILTNRGDDQISLFSRKLTTFSCECQTRSKCAKRLHFDSMCICRAFLRNGNQSRIRICLCLRKSATSWHRRESHKKGARWHFLKLVMCLCAREIGAVKRSKLKLYCRWSDFRTPLSLELNSPSTALFRRKNKSDINILILILI